MADTHETTEDIIAWLRRPIEGENGYLTLWRDEIADRLEAAWKREKAAIEADALEVGGMVEAAHIRELSKNVSKNGADFGQLGDAAREMRYLASRLLREWQDAVGSNPKFSRYGCMVRRYEKEFNELVREFDKKQLTAIGDAAKLREAISALRTALKEIRDDVLDMVMNHKSEDPDSYAHGLCLSIGGACDMALNSTKEFDNANK